MHDLSPALRTVWHQSFNLLNNSLRHLQLLLFVLFVVMDEEWTEVVIVRVRTGTLTFQFQCLWSLPPDKNKHNFKKNLFWRTCFLEVPSLVFSEKISETFSAPFSFQKILSYFQTPPPFVMTLFFHYWKAILLSIHFPSRIVLNH